MGKGFQRTTKKTKMK